MMLPMLCSHRWCVGLPLLVSITNRSLVRRSPKSLGTKAESQRYALGGEKLEHLLMSTRAG